MRSDALVAFLPIGGTALAITNVAVASTVIDLLGLGQGLKPTNIIGNLTNFGTDLGVGGRRPELNVSVGTAFATSASATLKIALQAAQDAGTPTYLPGTWQDIVSQDGITAANLTANSIPFRVPYLPQFPANFSPRFLRLLFTPSAAFTAGTIASAIVTTVRDDQGNRFAARNYAVS